MKILLALLLTGCGITSQINTMKPEQLRLIDNSFDLCAAYAASRSATIKTELVRREFIPSSEWSLVDAAKIRIGMTDKGLACSWGIPGVIGFGSINETVTSRGIRQQWVYRPCQSCKANYVYTVNGIVKSWQK